MISLVYYSPGKMSRQRKQSPLMSSEPSSSSSSFNNFLYSVAAMFGTQPSVSKSGFVSMIFTSHHITKLYRLTRPAAINFCVGLLHHPNIIDSSVSQYPNYCEIDIVISRQNFLLFSLYFKKVNFHVVVE